MDNPRQVITGIVLRQTDTKESDKILTVLTANLGKISVIARGCRKKNTKFGAACQLFAFSEMTLYEHKNWYYLEEANTKECFDGLRTDIESLALAAFLADLTDAVCMEGVIVPEVLSLLLNALYAAGTLKKDLQLVKTAFTWRILAYAGYEPYLDACGHCGKQEIEKPMFDIQEGFVHCNTCKEGKTLSMPLTAVMMEALRHMLFGEAKHLYGIKIDRESLKLLEQMSEAYMTTQLERKFKTLEYYKALLPMEVLI